MPASLTPLERAKLAGLYFLFVTMPGVRVSDTLLLIGPGATDAEILRAVSAYEKKRGKKRAKAVA